MDNINEAVVEAIQQLEKSINAIRNRPDNSPSAFWLEPPQPIPLLMANVDLSLAALKQSLAQPAQPSSRLREATPEEECLLAKIKELEAKRSQPQTMKPARCGACEQLVFEPCYSADCGIQDSQPDGDGRGPVKLKFPVSLLMNNSVQENLEAISKWIKSYPPLYTRPSEVINGEFINYRAYTIRSTSNKTVVKTAYYDDQGESDIPYIAAANPATIPSLIAELEQAKKDVAQLREVLQLVAPLIDRKDMNERIDAALSARECKG